MNVSRARTLEALARLAGGVASGDVPAGRYEAIFKLARWAMEPDAPPALASGAATAPTGATLAPLEARPGTDAAPLIAKPVRGNVEPATVRRLFDHWRNVMGRPAAKLTPERERVLRARLGTYTEAEIRAAINGCAASPFHCGENERSTKYDDLTLICRSGSKLEQFITLAPEAPPSSDPITSEVEAQIADARQELKDARDEKNADRYRAANARLAELLSQRRR